MACYSSIVIIKNKEQKISFTEKRIELLIEWKPETKKLEDLKQRCIAVLRERIGFLQKGL